MSALLNESRVSLTKLAQEQKIHLSTVWRWALRGVRGHRLECFSIGGRRYTTREAFERFVAATNGERLPTPQTPRQQQRSADETQRVLDEIFKDKRGA